MDSTRATTPTNGVRYEFGILYAALAFCALLNIFFTLTPIDKNNTQIDERLQKIAAAPASARTALYAELITSQEKNLARKPSEPYGWSRLAWLHIMNKDTPQAAFDALRMSDLVSPYEAPQLPERALMWYRLHDTETPDQQAYQDILWQKAYGMERPATWSIAVENKIDKQVGKSLKKTSPALYEEWKTREADKR